MIRETTLNYETLLWSVAQNYQHDYRTNTKQPIVKDITDFVWDCRDLGIMHMAEVTQCIVGRLPLIAQVEEEPGWQSAKTRRAVRKARTAFMQSQSTDSLWMWAA